jgi:RNA polymerase sporulation-specific sigma factor
MKLSSFHINLMQVRLAWERLLAKLGIRSSGGVFYVGGPDTLPPPLSRDEEAECISRLSLAETSERAKQTLIERNLRLVVYIARRFENTGIPIEDLVSIGTIGLIKSIGAFNPEKNIKLATYASRCVENEILMFLRKTHNQKTEISLDEPLNTDWDGNELLLSEILGTEEDSVTRGLEDDSERQMLREAVRRLGERERAIIELRFGLGKPREYTQKEVADAMGISQSYISRLEKRILSRLKRDIARLI